MHDLIAFLLGALTLFTGFYVWYTHRRFSGLKAIVREVIGRVGTMEYSVTRHERALDQLDTRLDTAEHRITFLVEDRQVPPENADRRVTESKQEKTAWDHLQERVDSL